MEELESYVVIQDGQSERDAIHNAPYEKVELFWPLELCRNGVEIIDSPGLNEHAIRQKVTMDYLSGVDAILFVLSCEALGSQSEMDVIENTLVKMGHQDIFFICNRFHAIRKKERESVRDYSIQKLAPFTEKGKERVYFIDALDALEGRLDGDQALVAESGVPLLEQDLEQFLATEKGRIKLMRSLQELRNATQEARRVIPERTAMLRTDGATLEARYAEAQEPLRQLEQKRGQMQAQLRNFQADMQLTVSDRAREFYRDMADKVEGWATSYELQSPVKFVSTKFLHQQIKIATEELVEHLSGKVEREVMSWQQSELQLMLEDRLEQRKQVLESIASDFVDQVDELRLQVSGLGTGALSTEVAETDVGRRKVGALERVLSAAGGFLIGGVGSASMGAIFGYEEMLKSLLPQIVLGIAAITLVGTNPLLLIPIMTGGGVIQGMLKTNGTNAKLKLAVAEKFAMQLRGSSYEQAEGMAKAVAAELGKLEAAVDDGLAAEIAGVRSQVESILAEKQRGAGCGG